jgi:hypothetical protein
MRESRTSGSVGDPGGNTRVYPTIFRPALVEAVINGARHMLLTAIEVDL